MTFTSIASHCYQQASIGLLLACIPITLNSGKHKDYSYYSKNKTMSLLNIAIIIMIQSRYELRLLRASTHHHVVKNSTDLEESETSRKTSRAVQLHRLHQCSLLVHFIDDTSFKLHRLIVYWYLAHRQLVHNNSLTDNLIMACNYFSLYHGQSLPARTGGIVRNFSLYRRVACKGITMNQLSVNVLSVNE